MKQIYNSKFLLLLCFGFCFSAGWAQVTVFTYTGSADTYTVPPGATSIEIEVSGAEGGSGDGGSGGAGATMIGTFTVIGGDVLDIVVGEQGLQYGNSGGGGGGSGVIFMGSPMVIAGGGGGGANTGASSGHGGLTTTDGGSSSGAGGTAGSGGEKGYMPSDCGWASGGGGFLSDGYGGDGTWDGGSTPGTLSGTGAGRGWSSGGAGGINGGCTFTYPNEGAWGCGGGGAGSYGGAGGGGYSGGGGGQYTEGSTANRGGGGGGSFNGGTDQVNTADDRIGNGLITITVLCNALTIDIPVTGVCIGDELYLSATSSTGGVVTWDGGVLDGVLFAPVLGTTTYTATSTSPDDCAYEVEISASEIPTIIASASSLVACEDGSVTVWGEGGDTYIWTGDADIDPIDSVSFLAESGTVTYTLIGSILGCEGPTVEVVIEGSARPDVTGVATPAELCMGQTFTLTGEGASTYYWGGTILDGDVISPETPGTFIYGIIGVTADGCGDTTSVTVVVNALPIVDGGLDMAQCVGMELTLNATGSDAVYTWDPSITDGSPFVVAEGETTYTVTATDANNCTGTDEVVITGIAYPVITAVVTDEFTPYGAAIDITVTGGSGSFGYTWSHGPITEDVTGLTGGSYNVSIDDIGVLDGVCPDVDSTFTIARFVGIDELNSSNISIYPNPTLEDITISFEGNFSYELLTINGDILLQGNATDNETLSLDQFATGAYLVKVIADGETSTTRIVKN